MVEVFELTNNKYKQTDITQFNFTPTCSINFEVKNLFD